MVRNWSRPATISQLSIDVNNVTQGQSIDLSGGFIGFKYYESLLSPAITAKLVIIDTGYSVTAGAGERSLNLFSLAEELVGNKLRITLANGSGNIYNANSSFLNIEPEETASLNFDTNYPLEVTSVSNVTTKDKKQILTINLCTEPGTRNPSIEVDTQYTNKISESVRKILKDELKVPESKIPNTAVHFTPTKNPATFYGNGRTPFDLILDMCPKAVPEIPANAAPGFFIFETQDGFYFRGIDSLLSSTPYPVPYRYRDTATFCEQSNFRILKYIVMKPSGDLWSQMKFGFNSKNIFYNPATFETTEIILSAQDKVLKRLGSDAFKDLYDGKGPYSQTNFFVKNPGNFDVGVSAAINNDPLFWYAAAKMRYNLLFARMIIMAVPCNLELRAGMIITCDFPALTDTPQEGVSDEAVSGKYLIVHLSHEFNSDGQVGSLTHLTVVRDTDGIYTLEED